MNSLKLAPKPNLLQSSDWAKIKDNWGNERLGVYQDHKLVAVASIFNPATSTWFYHALYPRGPIMDYQTAN